jgi:kynurenine 3-monooxygenase
VRVTGDVVIAADGAYSAIRARLQRRDGFHFRQDYLEHGYKELTIPRGPNGAFQLEKHALHIWPRSSFMMIALPNLDGSFTCTLFFPHKGPRSFESLKTASDVRAFFQATFPDAAPLMPALLDDFFRNPTGSLVTMRCHPWSVGDRFVMLGDAAHAVVPFYGQGMNAAFEDVTALSEELLRRAPDRRRAFEAYEQRRKPHVDALADLSIANYVEMRDRTAKRWFLWRKMFDKQVHRLFPSLYIPLYTLVTFTSTPYAEAVRRAKRQDRIALAAAIILLGAIATLIVRIMT